ncbi:MAG: hypothetical protein CMJ78_23900 [Planctomycetaceae bacterium]|nr:hypothetical protein [Planctomycetaceae bacterium]
MNSPFSNTSASLLQQARDQDQRAWRQLVELYGPLVQRWCKQSGLHDDDTADVFQETFRAVARGLDDYTPQKSVGSFRSWLRSIVRSKVADHFRRRRKQPVGRGGTDAQLYMDNIADPLEDDDPQEAEDDHKQIVQRAMELIRPDYSERNWQSFWQVAVEGETAVEVAERLEIDPQVVRQANYRIRRRLRMVLQDLIDD